jgi:hypothetical protein
MPAPRTTTATTVVTTSHEMSAASISHMRPNAASSG